MIRVAVCARVARWLLALPAVAIAYGAFDYSAANNLRRTNPEAAYRVRATEPRAVAAVMNERIVDRNLAALDQNDATNVRKALQRDPLNRVLLRTLAISAEVNGKSTDALVTMKTVNRVSRRDAVTQLWLGEFYRRENNPAKALVHYDAAMSVTPDIQNVLFPQMVLQLKGDDFKNAIRPYIVRGAPWAVPYVGTAALGDVTHAVDLIEPLLGSTFDGRHDQAVALLTLRMAMRGDGANALTFAAKGLRSISQKDFQAFSWNQATTDRRLGRLAWKLNQEAGAASSLDGPGRLNVIISPNRSAPVATRSVVASPNQTYELRFKVSFSDSAKASVHWKAECLTENGATLFWVSDDFTTSSHGSNRAVLHTPNNCYVLNMTVVASGGDTQLPSDISIRDVSLLEVPVHRND